MCLMFSEKIVVGRALRKRARRSVRWIYCQPWHLCGPSFERVERSRVFLSVETDLNVVNCFCDDHQDFVGKVVQRGLRARVKRACRRCCGNERCWAHDDCYKLANGGRKNYTYREWKSTTWRDVEEMTWKVAARANMLYNQARPCSSLQAPRHILTVSPLAICGDLQLRYRARMITLAARSAAQFGAEIYERCANRVLEWTRCAYATTCHFHHLCHGRSQQICQSHTD
jgi:hypothetical protein